MEPALTEMAKRPAASSSPAVSLVGHPSPWEALAVISRLLEYPTGDTADYDYVETAALRQMTAEEREEAYTATFEVTPACVPYVSIHLFGEENFQRGDFMAALSGRCQERGFDCRGELPDHLSNLLRLVATLDAEEAKDLMQLCLLGPVRKMLAGLGQGNPYRGALASVEPLIFSLHPALEVPPNPVDQKLAQSGCGSCDMQWDHDRDFLTGAAVPPELT